MCCLDIVPGRGETKHISSQKVLNEGQSQSASADPQGKRIAQGLPTCSATGLYPLAPVQSEMTN